MTNEVLLPQVAKTGAVAELTVTTRESSRMRATVNVRVALPRRTLIVTRDDGVVLPLPASPEEDTGLVVAQLPMGMN